MMCVTFRYRPSVVDLPLWTYRYGPAAIARVEDLSSEDTSQVS